MESRLDIADLEEKERFDRADLVQRAHYMDEKAIDEETRTVRVGVSSEEPVKREFGMEVIDHSRESMNLDFLNSGRAPLLLDHDMERQIGVVESVELDEDARRLRAIVRFGKGDRASEIFNDVSDGIRQNISVGYRVDGRVEREDDGEDIVRVSTTPMEISIVSLLRTSQVWWALVGLFPNLYTQPQRSKKGKTKCLILILTRYGAGKPPRLRRKAPKRL